MPSRIAGKDLPAGQDGIALLLCMFSLLLLTGIALGLIYMGDTETRVNDNFRSSQQAYFAARAGLEEVRDRMRTVAPNSIAASLPAAMPSTATPGVVYVVNPAGAGDVVQPWNTANAYADTELCQETFNLGLSGSSGIKCGSVPSGSAWYTSTASTSPFNNTNGALSYKWVRITYKGNGSNAPYYVNGSNASSTAAKQTQVCWSSTSNSEVLLTAANCSAMGQAYQPVYELTALAITPAGARRMTQEEVALLSLPPLPSGLTFDGPNPTFSHVPNSNQYGVSGIDNHIDNRTGTSCGAGQASMPAVGGWDNNAVTALVGAIPAKRANNYPGSGGSTPDVQNVGSLLASQWKTVDGLNALVSLLTSVASPGNVYSGAQSDINVGSDAAPQITVVNGDLTLSGRTTGSGILVVTGILTFNGTPTFDGVILVIGKGYMTVTGGGNGTVSGAVFVARTLDSSGNPLPSGSAPGSPTVDWSGGGGNGIQFDSCYTTSMNNLLYYQQLALHELPY